jgi:hypothetical protein
MAMKEWDCRHQPPCDTYMHCLDKAAGDCDINTVVAPRWLTPQMYPMNLYMVKNGTRQTKLVTSADEEAAAVEQGWDREIRMVELVEEDAPIPKRGPGRPKAIVSA